MLASINCFAHLYPVALGIFLAFVSTLQAAAPRALTQGTLPHDSRLGPLKDLNGYFPFMPPKTKEEWDTRAERVRRQILVAEGLWPMPTKAELRAVIHGKIERPDYTVEKVYFESAPGFFVTGNLYKPKKIEGKVPAVLFAHGHWKDARLSESDDAVIKKEIASGAERFDRGGRSIFQSMCVQLARMGCIVWQWDMLSDSDSVQLSAEVIHHFAKQRPEMNSVENWGLYSPQAEAHLQSVMGLQTWNAVRSLDFVLTLPAVDPDRIAMTGASGGGTQTMILSAIDPRIKLSFPAVMVSTAMQGGCTCENASLLRVDTGNVEFAALFAPKPLGMTTADDWTKQMSTKGFPQLQELYTLLGHPENVTLARGEQFPHNYNAISRAAFYRWLNKHFHLGPPEAEVEKDFEPLHRDQLTVWDHNHPAPEATGTKFERELLRWFADDADKQIRDAATSPTAFRKLAAPAVEVLVGRNDATAGDSTWSIAEKVDRGNFLEMTGLVHNKTYDEELPVTWLYPKKWNGHVVLWLDDAGKSTLFKKDGTPQPAIAELLRSGATVLGADLFGQGEFLKEGEPAAKTRTVENKREAPAYTYAYNHAVLAQRAHDILTLLKFIRNEKINGIPSPSAVAVAAFGHTGPVAAAAAAVAGESIDAAAIDTTGFRFASVVDYRDPMFLPGGAKYGDLPGFLALGAPHRLWLAGESKIPDLVRNSYPSHGSTHNVTIFAGAPADARLAAAGWLARE